MNALEKLSRLGFDQWFEERIDENNVANYEMARIVSVHRNSFMVTQGDGDIYAELIGKLAYGSESTVDLPTTGDWVYIDLNDNRTHAIIHKVFARKTLIKRKKSGKTVDFQLIAANIDTAFIVQALDDDFNPRRLERYLAMINENNITPVILFSKYDLKTKEETSQLLDSITSITKDVTVLPFSNKRGDNLDAIKALLTPAHTFCLLGSSGIGKTTLLNNLLGIDKYETKPVREKDGKGQHTTTSRELIQLENGAMIIDTPGMRELGNIAGEAGIEETFSDIAELALQCKFNNCSHTKEKSCAILSAIEAGDLSKERHQNYIKMKNESAFNEMSYAEKRKKDKKFGKMIKSAINKKK